MSYDARESVEFRSLLLRPTRAFQRVGRVLGRVGGREGTLVREQTAEDFLRERPSGGGAGPASATAGSQHPDATAIGSGDGGSSDTATSDGGPDSRSEETPSERAVIPAAAQEATAPVPVSPVTPLAGSGSTASGRSHATTPSDPSKTLLTVQFRRGSVSISDADRGRLRELVAECNRKHTRSVLLEGYGCSLGSTAVNHEIGTRRARAVEKYLQQLGLKARLDMVSFGSDFPVSGNGTEDSRKESPRCGER